MALATIEAPELSPDTLIRRAVCQTCRASLSAGDYCAEHLTRVCPLSRYAGQVIQILEDLQDKANEPSH
jgi:hypothetical protein